MSAKWKVVGATMLAIGATAVFVAVNAGAESGGHFVFGAEHVTLTGEQNEQHNMESGIPGLNGTVCGNVEAEATVTASTVEEIAVFTAQGECHTTDSETNYEYRQNGCYLKFVIGAKAEGDNTAIGVCPEKPAEVLHPSCKIIVPEQTVSGLSYKNIEEEGVEVLTVTSTIENITSHFEEGFCVLLGTTQTTRISGSVIIRAYEGEGGEPVDVTATGSED